ncbi:MAG: MazG nucleotide pyrophosphohydrolase domain-containing protein, partial [Hyphomicrobium sp.]
AEERAAMAAAHAKSPSPHASWGVGWGEGQDSGDAQTHAPHPSPLPVGRRGEGILADVSLALPALTRAVKLQDKAARVGFDWPSLAPVFDKMREELSELEHVALPADPRGATPDRSAEPTHKIEEELGDLLFVMANVARHLKIDPEAALRGANQKFMRRFAHIEQRLAEESRTPSDSTLAEMDALWDEAKANERK